MMQKKNLSCLLQAFRHPSHWALGGMKKYEGTSAFSEENPRDRRKSLLERRRRHVPNGTMEWKFASTLVFCRGGHLEDNDCRRGLPDSRQGGKLLEARYSQLRLFQVHGRRHRRPESRFTEARKKLAQQLSGRQRRTE